MDTTWASGASMRVATAPASVSATTAGHAPPPSGASSCGTGLSADSLTSNISDQYGPGSAAPPAGGARPSPRHSVSRRASAGGQLPGA